MMSPRNSDLEKAAITLCYKSYQRFCRNWKATTTQYSLHPGNEVKNFHHDAPPRTFVQNNDGTFSRCTCHGRLGYEEQCVHEIVIHKYQFKKELFVEWHMQRDSVTSSVHSLPNDGNDTIGGRYVLHQDPIPDILNNTTTICHRTEMDSFSNKGNVS